MYIYIYMFNMYMLIVTLLLVSPMQARISQASWFDDAWASQDVLCTFLTCSFAVDCSCLFRFSAPVCPSSFGVFCACISVVLVSSSLILSLSIFFLASKPAIQVFNSCLRSFCFWLFASSILIICWRSYEVSEKSAKQLLRYQSFVSPISPKNISLIGILM